MYDTIVVAVDATDPSSHAVTATRELAAACGDKVCLVHVIPRQVVAGKVAGTWDAEEHSAAERLLAQHAATLGSTGVPVFTEIRHALSGHVGYEIVTAASDHHAGLIVVGTRGRGPAGHLLLGSTAYQVVHLTDRPVLVVR